MSQTYESWISWISINIKMIVEQMEKIPWKFMKMVIFLSERLSLKLKCPMHLRYYPFDLQIAFV